MKRVARAATSRRTGSIAIGVSIASLLAFAVVMMAVRSEPARATGHPPYLDIRSAGVADQPPGDPQNVSGRPVFISITVGAAPGCAATPPGNTLDYGLLIDADRSTNTQAPGLPHPSFNDLGVDTRISATCNTGTDLFEGSIPGSTVTVTTNVDGTATIKISTTVGQLPSIDFNWVAYAQEQTAFVRLPSKPGHGSWRVHELALW